MLGLRTLRLGLRGHTAYRAGPIAPGGRAVPFRVAVYGDSFGQRAQDVIGTPGENGTSTVNPVTFNFATPATSSVGGVSWGIAAWMGVLSRGRYTVPYQLNFAVGGSNTGQLNQDGGVVSGTGADRLSLFRARMQAEQAAGRPVDLCIVHAGTNDGVTTFNLVQSYNNLLNICTEIVKLGIKVVLFTASPRGNSLTPSARLAVDRVGFAKALRDRLLAEFGTEPALLGKVKVANGWTREAAPGTVDGVTYVAGDILAGHAYDDLHPGVAYCRELALVGMSAADQLCPDRVTPPLAASVAGNLLGQAGQMLGSGGTVARSGNAATNAGFSMTGTAPDGWTVTPGTPAGGTWNGTDPQNVKGAVTVSRTTGVSGEAMRIEVSCDSSGRTNDNTVQIEARTSVPLPGLAEGDWIEGVVEVDLRGLSGFRGADLVMRYTEPDGVVRTVRTMQAPPNGTALRDWDPAASHRDTDALVLRTPPRQIKAGTYGGIEFAVVLAFNGDHPALSATATIERAGVRRIGFQP